MMRRDRNTHIDLSPDAGIEKKKRIRECQKTVKGGISHPELINRCMKPWWFRSIARTSNQNVQCERCSGPEVRASHILRMLALR